MLVAPVRLKIDVAASKILRAPTPAIPLNATINSVMVDVSVIVLSAVTMRVTVLTFVTVCVTF